MSHLFEARGSDSPYIESVWRGGAGSDYAPVCPASGYWHMLFLRRHGKVTVSIVGPLTRALQQTQPDGTEWLGITFPLGIFLPSVPARNLLDEVAVLEPSAHTFFNLAGSYWQFPDYDNAETFVEGLVRQNLLVTDPVVRAILQNQVQELSWRTIRRRFLFATGLTYKVLCQMKRAQQASALLEQGVALIDVAYQAGYADQPHMTRALKHFIGHTPAQIARGAIGAGGNLGTELFQPGHV